MRIVCFCHLFSQSQKPNRFVQCRVTWKKGFLEFSVIFFFIINAIYFLSYLI